MYILQATVKKKPNKTWKSASEVGHSAVHEGGFLVYRLYTITISRAVGSRFDDKRGWKGVRRYNIGSNVLYRAQPTYSSAEHCSSASLCLAAELQVAVRIRDFSMVQHTQFYIDTVNCTAVIKFSFIHTRVSVLTIRKIIHLSLYLFT